MKAITAAQQAKLDWLKLLGATTDTADPLVMYLKDKRYKVDAKGHIEISAIAPVES